MKVSALGAGEFTVGSGRLARKRRFENLFTSHSRSSPWGIFKNLGVAQNPVNIDRNRIRRRHDADKPGEQGVDMILFSAGCFLVESLRFIERTLVGDDQSRANRMIPGDWAKIESGWLARSLG